MRAVLQAGETFLALALGWTLVFALPFRVLASLLGTVSPAEAGPVPPAAGRMGLGLARRIERLAPRFPGRTTCLVRAVAGWLLLRRHGIGAQVRVGVRRSAGVLEAHAWLRVGDTTVLGGGEAEDFTPIADLGAAGGRWSA